MSRNIHFLASLLSAGLIAAAAPAIAAEGRTVQVHTADLDLSSAAGRAALHQRVVNAVDKVCEVGGWQSAIAVQRAHADCSSKAQASVAPQVDVLLQAQAKRLAASGDVSVSVQ